MSLEINKKGLSGKAIRVIENAKIEADVNKDGKIEGEQEISIFNKHIENSPTLSKKEVKQILGEKKVKEDREAKQARQEKKADKIDGKSNKEYFNNVLEAYVDKGAERKDIVKNLEDELINLYNYKISKAKEVLDSETATAEEKVNAQKEYDNLVALKEMNKEAYAPLVAEVNDVLNKVKNVDFSETSMSQVQDYFEKLIVNAKDKTERKILRQVLQMVKNEKINAAKNDIANRYATKVYEAEEKGLVKTDKEIMDEILKELKDEDKYVVDENYGESDQNEYVTAYKNFNDGPIAQQARILLANVITGKTNPEEINAFEIQKEAKQWLKDQGLWDINVKKANRKQGFGRKKSVAEKFERKIKLNTIKSKEELIEVFLGKNEVSEKDAEAKIKALMNTQVSLTDDLGQTIVDENGKPVMFNLITLREDGYYDLTNLSRYAGQQAGADNTFNKHKHAVNSEYGYLERGLNGAIIGEGLDLTDQEIENLVEAMGYPDKKNIYNVYKGLLGAAGGALAHGATAGIVTWTNPYQTMEVLPEKLDDIVIDLDLKTILGENATQYLQQGNFGIEITTEGYIKTTISNLFGNKDAFFKVVPKLMAENVVKSAALGAVVGLLAGFQESEEKPAVPLKVEQTNLEDYYETLNAGKETQKYAQLLCTLALAKGFVSEDGTLDNVGFETYLQRVFAGNDILNKEEFEAIQREYLSTIEHRHLKEKVPTPPAQEEETTPPPPPKTMEGSKSQYAHKYTVDNEILVVDGIKSSWENITKMYDKCIVPNRDAIDKNQYPNCYRRYNELAIRFVKVAQAINDGDYSLEHLLELAEATFAAKTSKYTELASRTDIDHNALLSAMNSDWLKDVKVPKKLGECTRVKDNPDEAKDMATEGAKNAPTGYAKDYEKTYHSKDVYGLQMGDGEIETFEDMKSRDDRYAELVQQNQEAGYTVTTVEKLTPQEVEEAYRKKEDEK